MFSLIVLVVECKFQLFGMAYFQVAMLVSGRADGKVGITLVIWKVASFRWAEHLFLTDIVLSLFQALSESPWVSKDEQKGKKRLEKTDHFWIAWWLDDCFEIFFSYLWLSKIKIHSKLVILDTEWENDWNFAVTGSPSLHISFIEASSSENWGGGCSIFQGACWEQGSTNVAWMRDLSQKGRRGNLSQRPWDWEVGETKLIDRDIHTVYTLMYLWFIYVRPIYWHVSTIATIMARHR